MLALSDLIRDQLRGPTVRVAPLVRLDFKSGESRLWPGFGPVVIAGETWQGIGNLGRLSPVGAGPGQAVEELTLTLFGDPTLLETLAADAEEASGREASAYFQFFDVRRYNEVGDWVDWTPLDSSPIQFFWGRMGPLIADRPIGDVAQTAPRSVSTRAANAFVNRRRPSFGFYSHRDQTARSDGTDKFCIQVSRMASATVNWPDF